MSMMYLSLLALGLFLLGVFVIVPWLAHRGDLDGIVEEAISSVLDVPIQIEGVESAPLGGLTVTHLRTVSAEADQRMRFSAHSISVEYDPFELLRGEIREVRFRDPSLFLNLDADLDGIAALPTKTDESAAGSTVPFVIRRVIIENGAAELRLEGRDLPIENLNIVVNDLGATGVIGYWLSAQALNAQLRVCGALETLRVPTPATHRFLGSSVRLEQISIDGFLDWLSGGPPDGEAAPEATGIAAQVSEVVRDGTASLVGTLDGEWPGDMHLRLTSKVDSFEAADVASTVALRSGQFQFELEADSKGYLDEVTFDVSASASADTEGARPQASRHQGSMTMQGRFARNSGKGGEVYFGPVRFDGGPAGSGSLSGTLSSVVSDEPLGLDFALTADSVQLARLLEFIPPGMLESFVLLPHDSRGQVDASVTVTGTVERPRASGSVRYRGAVLRVAGESFTEASGAITLDGLEVDVAARTGTVQELDVAITPINGATFPEQSPWGGGALPKLVGTLGVGATLKEASFLDGRVRGGLQLRLGVIAEQLELPEDQGTFEEVDATLTVDLSATALASTVAFTSIAHVNVERLLVGDIYAELEAPVMVRTRGEVASSPTSLFDGLEVPELFVNSPVTGWILGSLSVQRDVEGALNLSSKFSLPGIPTERAFETFVREPYRYSASFLEQAQLTGASSLQFEMDGPLSAPKFEGRLAVDGGWSAGDLTIAGLSASIPFRGGGWLPDAEWRQDGHLGITALDYGPLHLNQGRVDFESTPGATVSRAPLHLDVFDGDVTIERFKILSDEERGLHGEVTARANDVSLAALTRAYDLPEFPGELRFDWAPLSFQGSSLDVAGSVAASTLGGEVRFEDLSIDDVLEPYSNLRLGQGSVENIQMLQLGEIFNFGLVSGVLRGKVEGLEFTAGDATAFKMRVETVPTWGVAQYVDRRAIESIRRVMAGPFGAIEESLFSRYRYSRLGFECSLVDEAFYLQGKAGDRDVDTLMANRWYQVPSIRIVNAQPDRAYDWVSILDNLRGIYSDTRETVVE